MEDDRDHNHDGATEQTPLVGDSEREQRPRRPRHRSMLSVASITSVNVPKVHSGNAIVNLLCAILLISSSAGGFVAIPGTRIVEDTICHQYYDKVQSLDEAIDEKLCKGEWIQKKVAFIFASVAVCEAVVGFLAAFPWGIAADRLGRRPVFALSLTGMALGILWDMMVLWFPKVFPIGLVTLASVFILIGGGGAVLIGIVLSMVSDVIPEDKRAAAFMRIHISSLVGNLISPALASAMMPATGPWPVLCVAVACLATGAIACVFIPETLQHKHADVTQPRPEGFKAHVDHILDRLKESLSILKSPSIILLMITGLATTPLTVSVLQFLVQFVSKRYDIPIRNTGYIQAAYGVAQLAQAFVILPWISQLLLKDSTPKPFHMDNEQGRDLRLAKWSFGFVILGNFILGIAPTLWMFVLGLLVLALGSAYNSLTRSLMGLYIDPEHRSRLFTLVGMVEVIGNIYGSAMLAGLFTLGLDFGGVWIGLPYFGLAVISVIMVAILSFVRVPDERGPPPYEEGTAHED
ncbi:major facilitator superfamily transporter [Xylariales sp. AK1849]|nr:major facilitator superfamily transporter [Xylariales sp. AK1849]